MKKCSKGRIFLLATGMNLKNELHGQGRMTNLLKYLKNFLQRVYRKVLRLSAALVDNLSITFFRQPPKIAYEINHPDGPEISSKEDYLRELKFYKIRSKKFEDYLADRRMPPKKYIDLKFAVYFQCFDQQRATAEALKSFRSFYPDIAISLLSDKGEDFRDVAKRFRCDYTYAEENLGYWPCKDIKAWFRRLYDTCSMYKDAEWILLLEDDIRTRDRISKYPNAHLAGQAGGVFDSHFFKLAKEYIWKLYPGLEINGYSGCGGSIFHRKSFLICYDNINRFDVGILEKLDKRLGWATDISLDYLFHLNGFISRRWLDLSAEKQVPVIEYGPASAFDHHYKEYYNEDPESIYAKRLPLMC